MIWSCHNCDCRFILCVLIAELLHNLFNIAYDLDLVDTQEFYNWRDDDQVMYGKGTAVASVKPFFDWLKADKVQNKHNS